MKIRNNKAGLPSAKLFYFIHINIKTVVQSHLTASSVIRSVSLADDIWMKFTQTVDVTQWVVSELFNTRVKHQTFVAVAGSMPRRSLRCDVIRLQCSRNRHELYIRHIKHLQAEVNDLTQNKEKSGSFLCLTYIWGTCVQYVKFKNVA